MHQAGRMVRYCTLVDAIVTDLTWNNGNCTEPPRGMASSVGFLPMATSVPMHWHRQDPTAGEAGICRSMRSASRS